MGRRDLNMPHIEIDTNLFSHYFTALQQLAGQVPQAKEISKQVTDVYNLLTAFIKDNTMDCRPYTQQVKASLEISIAAIKRITDSETGNTTVGKLLKGFTVQLEEIADQLAGGGDQCSTFKIQW
ncbi:MAG: hypothetical protein GY765_16305 [bacterium]|nr:hypothetical protein [bacterium]